MINFVKILIIIFPFPEMEMMPNNMWKKNLPLIMF